ncbi:MAG: 50S ribosomal protein L1 [Actinomycetota bacterium]
MQHGKRYVEAASKVDRNLLMHPVDAIRLVKETNVTKFDATIDIALRLGIDPRKADQMVRGTVSLPHGTGKTVRVAVFAAGDKAREATEAGADVVGEKDLVERVGKGFLDFDVAVATPDLMGQLGKLGKLLGPRGLMPNPKSGTVTNDVGKAVREIKAGKLEYRADRQGNLHLVIGKVSFEHRALVENYQAVLEEISRAKPSAAKGRYLKSITLSATMGPGVKVDPSKVRELWPEEAGS